MCLCVIDQCANPLTWIALLCAPLPLFPDIRKLQMNENTMLMHNYLLQSFMRTAASSLMSVKIFGYPIYMSVAVISLIFAMHGRKMIHVCFCDVLPGWEIQFGQIRRGQEYLLGVYMIVCLWDISLPLWMRSIVRNVFPGKVGGFWLLCKSFMIDSTIQSWRNCIWSKKLISINDL